MAKKILCSLSRYDYTQTSPPYKMIHVGEFLFMEPVDGNNYEAFQRICAERGCTMKFWTHGKEKYKYDIIVVPHSMRDEEAEFIRNSTASWYSINT